MNDLETKMLSPHEFATLMLIRNAPEQIDMNRAELDTLLERQLVELEELAEGHRRPMLTPTGQSLLAAARRLKATHTPPQRHVGAEDAL
ncbi:hypothetical protein B0O95_104219 [Mycetohabitans endofungorum]|uniref:Preprotein translocase subunit SecA n=2 Tax=Burkholderiaceae TaxID=119060 RepID=A0A2P5KC35_9BURK|nr:hypothetical protein B0O95_104219 [Mycetohabitans endofungorum]